MPLPREYPCVRVGRRQYGLAAMSLGSICQVVADDAAFAEGQHVAHLDRRLALEHHIGIDGGALGIGRLLWSVDAGLQGTLPVGDPFPNATDAIGVHWLPSNGPPIHSIVRCRLSCA